MKVAFSRPLMNEVAARSNVALRVSVDDESDEFGCPYGCDTAAALAATLCNFLVPFK
jgi:hypothetical protein